MFPPVPLGGTATASLRVAYLRTVTGIQQLDLHVAFTDAKMTGSQTKIVSFQTNTDQTASATDDVEAATVAACPRPKKLPPNDAPPFAARCWKYWMPASSIHFSTWYETLLDRAIRRNSPTRRRGTAPRSARSSTCGTPMTPVPPRTST